MSDDLGTVHIRAKMNAKEFLMYYGVSFPILYNTQNVTV